MNCELTPDYVIRPGELRDYERLDKAAEKLTSLGAHCALVFEVGGEPTQLLVWIPR